MQRGSEGKGVLTGGLEPRGPLVHIHPRHSLDPGMGSDTAQCLAHGSHSAVIRGVSAPRMVVMVGAEGMGVFPQLLSPGPGPESWRTQFKSVGLYRSPLCLSTYFPPGFKGSPRPYSGSQERLKGVPPLCWGSDPWTHWICLPLQDQRGKGVFSESHSKLVSGLRPELRSLYPVSFQHLPVSLILGHVEPLPLMKPPLAGAFQAFISACLPHPSPPFLSSSFHLVFSPGDPRSPPSLPPL